MKRLIIFISIFLLFLTGDAIAVFNSGSTGADGAFNPTSNTQLQLPPNGIFNFTTVNIPSGVTVTFIKNAANTPIYILATGDVTISGIINLSGTDGQDNGTAGKGGPGGYDGGSGGTAGISGGNGLGPGGGQGPGSSCDLGGGGGYATAGGKYGGGCNGAGGPIYGNARILPLIGGSGGGGGGNYTSVSGGGGGGGGAILIASNGNISVTGTMQANGGSAGSDPCGGHNGGGGSGGGIRLIANSTSGDGTITSKGGKLQCGWHGGSGRIRIEAYTNNRTAGTDPAYSYGLPGSVFVSNAPVLSITSIAGINVPANPAGSYTQPDMMLSSTTTNPVAVNVSASYIPVGTTVTVRVMPQYGGATDVTTTLSGTQASSTGSANVNLSTTYSNVVTALATYTMQQAMYFDGEKIEKVRVAATMGKEPETIYISESGKEIRARELILAGLVK